MQRSKPLRRLLLGAVLLGPLLASACGKQEAKAPPQMPPPTVSVATPLQKTVTEWDEYTGRFDAVDTVEVRARISGVLTEVNFQDGAQVNKGDLLFVIDPRPFERVLDRDRAALEAAKVQAEYAQKDLERARPLLANNTISQQLFDQRLQALRVAEANVLSATASVRSAQLDVEFTRITAPISGRISRKFVSEGNFVTGGSGSGTLLTTIVSNNPIYFYFDISESDYLKYTKLTTLNGRSGSSNSNPVQLALQGDSGFPHTGKVDFIDNRIDIGTGSLRIRAVFDNSEGHFEPGLFARARMAGSQPRLSMLLPEAAIVTDQSNRAVFTVADDGTVTPKPVVLGPVIEGMRVIRNGITPNDWVIVTGTQKARAGAKVKAERITLDGKVAAAVP